MFHKSYMFYSICMHNLFTTVTDIYSSTRNTNTFWITENCKTLCEKSEEFNCLILLQELQYLLYYVVSKIYLYIYTIFTYHIYKNNVIHTQKVFESEYISEWIFNWKFTLYLYRGKKNASSQFFAIVCDGTKSRSRVRQAHFSRMRVNRARAFSRLVCALTRYF